MASPADVPRIAEPIAGNGGHVTRAWLDFFLKLASAQTEQNLAELYAQLAARVAELEDGQSLSFQLLGQGSIGVQGIPQPGGAVIITLQNDDDAPGNTMFYGTGPTGAKGWFSVSSAIAGTTDQIVKTTGPDGVVTLGLADLADSGTGSLLAITRDAKGRLSGTRAATTTDLAEGTNLYFTDARADARINLQKGQPNGLTPLGSDSKIPSQYLPPLAITSTFVVNSQAAQLALDAQEGDVAVRTDLSKNYIHNAGTTGTMADWTELLTPAAPVQSVNGQTGNVELDAADVGAATAAQGALADSAVQEVVAGAGISVDSTDPQRPVVSATASGGFVPFFIPDGQTFTVPAYQQALFTLPIELGDGSSIDLDGALVEVS